MSTCSLFLVAIVVAALMLLSMAIYLFVVSACTALDRWYRPRGASEHPRWARIVATCAYLALWLATAVYGSTQHSARSSCEEWISPGSHPTLIDPTR